jgi:hypothetical protein
VLDHLATPATLSYFEKKEDFSKSKAKAKGVMYIDRATIVTRPGLVDPTGGKVGITVVMMMMMRRRRICLMMVMMMMMSYTTKFDPSSAP